MPALSFDLLVGALSATFGDRLRHDEPLAEHSMLRLGGPADLWVAVQTTAELVEAVTLARRHETPVFILGSGANLLISDAGLRGLVIENRTGRVEFPVQTDRPRDDTVFVRVESGVVLPRLARRCARRGLSGLEWVVGVPGTVGGAVVNNAGAFGSNIAHNLVRAELLSPENEREWRPVSWFAYDYRTSRLKRQSPSAQWVVLQAELQLTVASTAEIEARMNEINERRRASQPPGATIGSMFKNPPGDYAGRLIEAAGLKGYRHGQAQISPVHANFFENQGGATATDMLALIDTAREAVARKFGIELELEIEVIG